MTPGQYWQELDGRRIPYKRRFAGSGLDFGNRDNHIHLALMYATSLPPGPNNDHWHDNPDSLGTTGL